MIRIGIIGAENSHCRAIARLCNLDKQVDAQVVAVWGETAEAAAKAAAEGQIPTVVADWKEMLGKVDGIMIDHRHPKFHAEPARFFLGKGVPVFVDKPFTDNLRDAKALCALARRKKTALTSFSVIAEEESFRRFRDDCAALGKIEAFVTTGPADVESKHGGLFFYGVHQVEAVVELLGHDIERVQAVRHGRSCVAVLHYRNGGPVASINMIQHGSSSFHWAAAGEKGFLAREHVRDAVAYVGGLKVFVDMFKTGKEPLTHARLLAPVAILEAVEKSMKLKKPVRMARF